MVHLENTQVNGNYSSREYVGGVGKRLEEDLRAEKVAKENYAKL